MQNNKSEDFISVKSSLLSVVPVLPAMSFKNEKIDLIVAWIYYQDLKSYESCIA